LTGASGFLGKAVLAKLLCGAVGVPSQIFVLLRGKKNVSSAKRLEEILKSSVFDVLRRDLGDEFRKHANGHVVVLSGDLEADGLGLEDKMRAEVIAKCTVVLNCAASTDWTETLVTARNTNTRGPLKVLDLAAECHMRSSGGFQAFVHVSSTYANENLSGSIVEEKLYSSPTIDPELFLSMSDEEITQCEQDICVDYSSAYFVSKFMAEHLLSKRAQDIQLPFVIVRPSAIGCAWSFPQPGWVEGVAGTNGFVLLGGTGVWTKLLGDPSKIIDIVPVDTVVDAVIAAAVCHPGLSRDDGHAPIVHAGSSSVKPLLIDVLFKEVMHYFTEHPSTTKQLRPTNLTLELSRSSFDEHMDVEIQKGGAYAKAAKGCIKANELFEPILTQQWIFASPNLSRLITLLSASEEMADSYSSLHLDQLDWQYYTRLYCYGVRRFLLLEEDAFRPTFAYAEKKSFSELEEELSLRSRSTFPLTVVSTRSRL
jgi:thioester reductase-like protein